jgi:hypothetical protein
LIRYQLALDHRVAPISLSHPLRHLPPAPTAPRLDTGQSAGPDAQRIGWTNVRPRTATISTIMLWTEHRLTTLVQHGCRHRWRSARQAHERIRPVPAIRVALRYESLTGATTGGRENGMNAVRRIVVVAMLLVLLGLAAGFDVSVDSNEERSRGSALTPTAVEYAVMLAL